MSDFYFDVPPSLYRIIQRLQGAGYRIVIVGGAVRDCLRKAKYSDYDLASNASPRQIQKLFRRCLPTGIKHGTVTILEGNDSYEITSFRNDGAYKDGRHPESVTFTGDLPGDLARRDFTINALAFEPIKQVEPSSETKGSPKQFYGHLHDLYGGQNHLQEGVICAIGPPDLRFEEDALRMLRACRFSAQLGFRIEEKTLLAIRRQHSNLKKVSRPRILQELRKLFCALYAKQGLDYLWQSQLWQTVFEGLPACDSAAFREPWGGTSWGGTFGGRTFGGALDLFDRLCRLRRTEDNWGNLLQKTLREETAGECGLSWHEEQVPVLSFIWALFHQSLFSTLEPMPEAKNRSREKLEALLCASPPLGVDCPHSYRSAEKNLDSLGVSNREKNGILGLLENIQLVWGPLFLHICCEHEERGAYLRAFLALWGPNFALPALYLLGLSSQAHGTPFELWHRFSLDLLGVISQKPALSIKELAIDGQVLARDCGIPPGRPMGRLLQKLLAHVLRHPENNRREKLLQLVEQYDNGSQ